MLNLNFKDTVRLIKGDRYVDERGIVSFINDFDLREVRRFYSIKHPNKKIIRAWQGHKKESKWFYCSKGRFLINAVKIDDWVDPSPNLTCQTFLLDEKSDQVLFIPAGHANGLKALENNSKILVFSNLTLQEAKNDNYRFNVTTWYDWYKPLNID